MATAKWIWESSSWPQLRYDGERLADPLKLARAESGRLFGKAEALGAGDLSGVEREVWSSEAMDTSAIEGEDLPLDSVRSSVAQRLGIDADFVAKVPRKVEGLLDVMENAAADWDGELTDERLGRWQAALFPAGGSALRSIEIGRYRSHDDPMQIVSGPPGRQRVHYAAPPSAAVRAEMRSFLRWFNDSREGALDGILRAGQSHLWFESIHPFEDGNGRVGRAVMDLALAQDARKSTRLHGMSSELRRRQKDYYVALNRAQRGDGDITEWLEWFTRTYAESCRATGKMIDESIMRARFWSDHKSVDLNERQRKALNKILAVGAGNFTGGLTLRKYLHMTGATRTTGFRDIDELVEAGILLRQGTGRGTYYNLSLPGWAWRPES